MRKAASYYSVGVMFLAWAGGAAGATTHYVPADYTTIQAAIDASNNGDQIEVAPGTYYQVINFNGKAVRLYSSHGLDQTTLTKYGEVVVQCVNGEGSGTILEGFTLIGSWGGYEGGGMRNVNSSPTVINCAFRGCQSTHGGGMYNSGSSPTVTDCSFIGNWSNTYGGGIYSVNSSPIVTNCTFIDNEAESQGGGMYDEAGRSTVLNCTFSGNWARLIGGGLYCQWGSNCTVINCTFSGNNAPDGSGIYIHYDPSTVSNCIFWANVGNDQVHGAAVTYSCVQGGYSGVGNINTDPLFVGGGDLRLQAGSPCIDTGNNAAVPPGVTTDLDGNSRIVNGVVDMGAYELQGSTPVNAPPVAVCRDVQKYADQSGYVVVQAAEVDAGSYDPDGDPITLSLDPAGPYPLGETPVTLTATDDKGASGHCSATITVLDSTVTTVYLKDHLGSGLAGQSIKVQPAYGGSWGDVYEGTTEADGSFRCTMEPGYTKIRMTLNQASVEQTVAELGASGYTWTAVPLTIRVQDSRGEGVVEAKVDQGGGTWVHHGYSDSAGELTVYVFGNKQYKFRVGLAYTSETRSFEVPGPESHTEVFETVAATVRVTDYQGQGIAGVQVRQSAGSWVDHGCTDASGELNLELFGGQNYTFRVSGPAVSNSSQTAQFAVPGSIEFQAGRVVSAGAAVKAAIGGSWVSYAEPGMSVLPGTYKFIFSAPTPSPQMITVVAGEVVDIP